MHRAHDDLCTLAARCDRSCRAFSPSSRHWLRLSGPAPAVCTRPGSLPGSPHVVLSWRPALQNSPRQGDATHGGLTAAVSVSPLPGEWLEGAASARCHVCVRWLVRRAAGERGGVLAVCVSWRLPGPPAGRPVAGEACTAKVPWAEKAVQSSLLRLLYRALKTALQL